MNSTKTSKSNTRRKSTKTSKGKKRKESTREYGDGESYISTKEDLRIAKDVFVLAKTTKFSDDYVLKETLGEGAYGVVGK